MIKNKTILVVAVVLSIFAGCLTAGCGGPKDSGISKDTSNATRKQDR